jgi:hypothetical protein
MLVRALGAKRSPVRRRRRALTACGCALAALLGWAPLPSLAQSPPAPAPTTDPNLLAPSLDNAPANPPPFRMPGEAAPNSNRSLPPGTFTAQSRIGATPSYGSPSGFGAGDTGFDSLNMPHNKKRKKQAQTRINGSAPQPDSTFTPVPNFAPPAPSQPPPIAKPPPPVIYPKKAAQRPGATLPPQPEEAPVSNPPPEVHPQAAANRPGATLAVPPAELFDYSLRPSVIAPSSTPPPTLPQPNTFPPGTLPQRPLPIAATDPYAAIGIRVGSFLLFPSLDLSAGYNTNPTRETGGPASFYGVAAPELKIASDWAVHSFTADIVASYTQYTADLLPSLNLPYLNSKIDGRIDVTRDTQILLQQRVIISADNPGSPNLQAQVAKLPPNQDFGDTLGVAQQFNRLSLSFKGLFDRATYDPSPLTDGTSASNADRDFNQYAGVFRVGYELDPGLKPFLEVQEDQRIHDEQFDRNDLQRDSTGTTAHLGAVVDLFGTLTGEMALGYVDRVYKDPTLPAVTGFIADGALLWKPTGLTTYKLAASSQVYETVLDGASGELSRDISLEVDHAFRAWLIGIGKAGFGTDDYVGQPLSDNRYFVSVGLTYIFTRELQMHAEIREDWMTATEPGFAYNSTTFLLGVRVQR